MRITAIIAFAFIFVFLASACFADGPDALAGGSVQGRDAETGPRDTGGDGLADYYNQKMLTVEGVITAIDLEAGSIDIRSEDGENTYTFDELTRFQVRLKPVEPSELRVGSRMAGLYMSRGGSLYIGRVVVITGEKAKRRRRR